MIKYISNGIPYGFFVLLYNTYEYKQYYNPFLLTLPRYF